MGDHDQQRPESQGEGVISLTLRELSEEGRLMAVVVWEIQALWPHREGNGQ